MASLATIRLLTSEDIASYPVYPPAPPRVGDNQFATSYDDRLPRTLRFSNRDDIVLHRPFGEALDIPQDLPGGIFKDLKDLPLYEHLAALRFIKWDCPKE